MRLASRCAVLAALALLLAPAASAQSQSLTADQWRDDLRVLAAEIQARHRNAYHKISKEELEAAVKRLHDRIPSLSDREVKVELVRIVALVGDGHTGVHRYPFGPMFGFRFYPVALHHFADGVFVRAAAPAYAEVVGGRVVSIDGTPIDDAIRAVAPLVARDNDMSLRLYAPLLLSVPEIASAAGVVMNMEAARLEVEKDGARRTVTLAPTTDVTFVRPYSGFWKGPDWVDARDRATEPAPLWIKDVGNAHWFEYLPDSRTVYVQYNEVSNKPDETVAAFAARLFDFVAKTPADRIVFDLRWNGGGNNYLNRPLLLGLLKSKLDERGKVFVITGRHTFSAAQNFVNTFERFTNAIFVGEPTGASPNHFGDASAFTLPNSKIVVQASTLWWQDMDPRDARPWIGPHIAAELTFDEYRNNVDPAMRAILAYTPRKPLAEEVDAALAAGNTDLVRKLVREFVADPANKYQSIEVPLNRLGYQLLGAKRVEDAVAVFELNAEAYPESWNVWDSLAEGHMTAGRRDLAIKYYEKSVRLNPDNHGGREALERLRGEKK
jgi:hypothetical protein